MSDLARLSLQDPEYIAVDAEATTATPSKLKQCYIKCELHTKMDLLWFFIKTHLKKRTIVFLSTCKQVRSPCDRATLTVCNSLSCPRITCSDSHSSKCKNGRRLEYVPMSCSGHRVLAGEVCV